MRNLLLLDRLHISGHGLIRRTEGTLYPVCCPPKKPDAPFLLADQPWESGQLNWANLRVENGRFRLWYEAMTADSTGDADTRLCYAESTDGVHWEKPELGLIEFDGSRRNNIVMDGRLTHGIGLHGVSVFVDPNSPPEARYRCMFLGAFPHPERADGVLNLMSLAYSADGIVWRHGTPDLPQDYLHFPMTCFGSDTQCSVFWDPDRRCYAGYFRTLEANGMRSIGCSETTDLNSWPMPKTILAPDLFDPPVSDYYNSAASRYVSGGDAAYFFFYSLFDHDTETLSVRLATSRDGIHFDRADRSTFIANDRSYDRGGLYVAPGIADLGNGECAIVYNATNRTHAGTALPDTTPSGTVMLRFPKDRLQGLRTDSRCSFTLLGRVNPRQPEVFVNGIIRGRLRGGLIVGDHFLEGFTPDDCIPISGDVMHAPLVWRGGQTDAASAELKLFLEDGTLFAVTVNE